MSPAMQEVSRWLDIAEEHGERAMLKAMLQTVALRGSVDLTMGLPPNIGIAVIAFERGSCASDAQSACYWSGGEAGLADLLVAIEREFWHRVRLEPVEVAEPTE